MTSAATEPPTLRSIPPFSAAAAAASNRRSYSCYNCNYSFHIIPIPSTSASSPSSFRCPCCHHRHLIPHHTISLPLSPPPPPPPPASLPPQSSDYASDYQTSDESDSEEEEEEGEEDYDSDNSLLSLTQPSFHFSSPALKSFVASLPIKNFAPNSAPPLQSCSICMEDFEISSEASLAISELPCEHYFHKNCIVEWLQRSNTCPLCRYKLPVDGSPEEGTATGTNRWEVEYDAVVVVDLGSIRGPTLGRADGERGVNGEENLGSNAAALGSDGLVSNMNGRGTNGLAFDGMRGEDGSARAEGGRGFNGEEGLDSNTAALGSDGLAMNDREASGLEFDAMRDEDGDTLMVDA